ncbi:MAG: AAA family ATPase [Myxococcales bacterium]|nr:AAA family ATPase [Myxococcales bacterium]
MNLIGSRYRVLNQLGSGGMGQVHRAMDLVTGRVVAVKSVKAALSYIDVPTRLERGGGVLAEPPPESTGSDSDDTVRAALAHEFELLSNLRHENIVSVLDYGFDDRGQPYYAMELAEGAETITQAATNLPIDAQVELVVQLLRGLDYLHWCGILHRDLKPSNVLVVDGKVKLLDFGIAIAAEHLSDERSSEFGGTLAYVAPEVLRGTPASTASDLYGVGLIAYQMMTGHNPRSMASRRELVRDVLTQQLDGNVAGIPASFAPVLTRLLDGNVSQRYADARAALDDVKRSVGGPLQVETISSRESFLASAPLVGRDAEMSVLRGVARAALNHEGAAVLVGGPSGMGKTRLVEETRIFAQVRGAVVLRGQAVSAAGTPYQLWVGVCRRLVLLAGPTDVEAGVLRAIVPDIEDLLGRPVPEATSIPAAQTQARLGMVVQSMLLRLARPLVLILEDLQWASQESLRILADLIPQVIDASILILAAYRSDEAADLPERLPGILRVEARPLTRDAVADFVRRVGSKDVPDAMIDGLLDRTEGNPFFLVELLRTMAGEAQDLRAIAKARLPERSVALQRLAQEQLRRVPPTSRPLLEMAAVAGRDVDLDLLETLAPTSDLKGWVGACTRASLFEVREGSLRFAHDKVREGILAHLGLERRTSIHRRIAETLEARGTAESRYLPALVHHWSVAGEAAKERDYAARAGRWALESGACHEAVVFLSRALELVEPVEGEDTLKAPTTPTSREDLQALLTEANFQLGRLEEVRRHGVQALVALGHPMPTSTFGLALGMFGQLTIRVLQSLLPSMVGRIGPAARAHAVDAMRVQERLMELFIYAEQPLQIMWAGLKLLNLGERLGESPELARGYGMMGVVAGSIPLHGVAESWGDRARELAEAVDPGGPTLIPVVVRRGVYGIGAAKWERTEAEAREGLARAEALEDYRGADECRIVLAKTLHYASRFDASAEVAEALWAAAQRRDDRQAAGWGMLARVESRVRAGRHEEVLPLFTDLDAWVQTAAASTERICPLGMMALAHWRRGRAEEARALVERVLEQTRTTNILVYWTLSGLAATAEILFEMGNRTSEPHPHVAADLAAIQKALEKFARVFPIGKPWVLRTKGWVLWHKANEGPSRAAWAAAAEEAARLVMPFEEGAARLDLARFGAPEGERAALIKAARGPLSTASARHELGLLDALASPGA